MATRAPVDDLYNSQGDTSYFNDTFKSGSGLGGGDGAGTNVTSATSRDWDIL